MKNKKLSISIIVPVYNEERRIGNVKKIISYLIKKGFDWELIVVNDGSTDKTLSYLKRINNPLLKVISYKKNLGKGGAVKKGMLKVKKDFGLFLDIDLSTPIEEIEKVVPYLNEYEVVIGTRKAWGSKVLKRQPWLRESLGRGFTWLSRVSLGVYVSDFTCGFKCFSKKAIKKIFGKIKINRWGFDSEVLYLANKYGFLVKEIPVVWNNDSDTKVKFPGDLIQSLLDIGRILVYDWVMKIY